MNYKERIEKYVNGDERHCLFPQPPAQELQIFENGHRIILTAIPNHLRPEKSLLNGSCFYDSIARVLYYLGFFPTAKTTNDIQAIAQHLRERVVKYAATQLTHIFDSPFFPANLRSHYVSWEAYLNHQKEPTTWVCDELVPYVFKALGINLSIYKLDALGETIIEYNYHHSIIPLFANQARWRLRDIKFGRGFCAVKPDPVICLFHVNQTHYVPLIDLSTIGKNYFLH